MESNNNCNSHNSKCDGCICHIQEKITEEIFHFQICVLHKIYIEKYKQEEDAYKKTGENFFINFVHLKINDINKEQIRDPTIDYLVVLLNKNFLQNSHC
jgi:hypothetical protein